MSNSPVVINDFQFSLLKQEVEYKERAVEAICFDLARRGKCLSPEQLEILEETEARNNGY